MIVSIMQPYFFPYIGYFQLVAACDTCVLFDDAQYIKNGWINRNRILVNDQPKWLTLPVTKAAHSLPINRRLYQRSDLAWRRLLFRIEGAYKRAPQFEHIYPVVADIMAFNSENVAMFNANLIRKVTQILRINTRILVSSDLPNPDKRAEQRVIDICTTLGATTYRNPIGGTALYNPTHFLSAGLSLEFLRSEARRYEQFGKCHVPALSIIDVLMFNDEVTVRQMLQEFSLLREDHHSPPSKPSNANQANKELRAI